MKIAYSRLILSVATKSLTSLKSPARLTEDDSIAMRQSMNLEKIYKMAFAPISSMNYPVYRYLNM